MNGFRSELESLINRFSKENGSNTPDFILAEFLENCLDNFDKAVSARMEWRSEVQVPNNDLSEPGSAS